MHGRRTSRGAEGLSEAHGTPAKTPRRPSFGSPGLPPLTPTQEGSERVKVFVRVRPPSEKEAPSGLRIDEGARNILLPRKNENTAPTEFRFDQILDTAADQQVVYKAAVEPIVEDVLQGYNGTIMAYGQTGAGKTYTLSSVSSADNIGMMPRAAAQIFNGINADPSHIYNVVMAYAQIYMEQILDLLKPDGGNLQIREGNHGVFIAGIEEQPVTSVKDCLSLMQHGDQNRKTALTAMNAHSSRSHAIVMLTVVKRLRRSATSNAIADDEEIKVGKLFIVDLAGSERLKKSLSTGLRADEAKAINLSLTTLGLCINSRADRNSKHTPFRDSKLTRLLQESLGGNAKTSLLVAIADAAEHLEESLQSIQFGQRAMRVQTKARINESVGKELLNASLLKRLSSTDIATCVVDANLLAKEVELREIQEALAGERERNLKAIRDLEAARVSEQQTTERVLTEAQAKLSQQEQEAQRHERELAEIRGAMTIKESQLHRETEALQSKLRAVESDHLISKASMMEQIHKYQASIQSLESNLTAASEKTFKAEQAFQSSEAKVEELKKSLEETASKLQKELDCTKAQLKEAQRQNSSSKAEYDETLQKYEDKLTKSISSQKLAEKSAKAQATKVKELQTEINILQDDHDAATQHHNLELQQLSKQVDQLEEALAKDVKALQVQLQANEATASQVIRDVNERAAERIESLEAELESAKMERVEAERQASQAHEQAAGAHNQAAAATQEQVAHTQRITEQYDTHLRDMRDRHTSQMALMKAKYAEQLEAVEQKLADTQSAGKYNEEGLMRDLDDLRMTSNQRTKDLRRQLEVQEAELKSKLEDNDREFQHKLAKQDVYAASLFEAKEAADEKLAEERLSFTEVKESLNNKIALQEIELAQKSASISESLARISELENEYQKSQSRLHELQEENKATRSQLSSQLEEQAGLAEQLRSERNRDAQDLAMERKRKHDLEGKFKGLEADSYAQQLAQGKSLVEASRTLLDEALMSLKINFLMDSKSRLAYSSMEKRTPSMSPLGNLGARGIHYSQSLLARSSSFISVSSDKSSSLDGPHEGPLGAGPLIPAAYPTNGLPPRPALSTPRQAVRNGSSLKPVQS